jgi:hypothetical protein
MELGSNGECSSCVSIPLVPAEGTYLSNVTGLNLTLREWGTECWWGVKMFFDGVSFLLCEGRWVRSARDQCH